MIKRTGLGEGISDTLSGGKWKRIDLKARSGLLVPLFSVYSQRSLGIGDLADLELLVDWCVKTGNTILQLLPMNELGGLFCPYDSISSFALEPVYLCLEKVSCQDAGSITSQIDKVRQRFPAGSPYVDYQIKQEKINLLWQLYLEDDSFSKSLDFRKFKEENLYWLEDFSLFKALKDYHRGRAWYEWDQRYRNRDSLSLENFKNEHQKEIAFEVWMQWRLYQQFKEAKNYAESKKILLKGDLPILVSRDSADVWGHPEFFKLDFAAGAPPDMYCAKGQRWGMPTYNWENIARDGFRYLKEKLKYLENFYDILRIDHVVGLFRIWSIPYNEPLDNQGLHGFFDPQDENKWLKHGRDILTVMLNNTNMLLCAEDLGVIPKICPDTLEELGMPGNDVQRWVKDWKVSHDFLSVGDYRHLSVSMLSTHDTTNWAAWWENEVGTVDEALFIRKCNGRGIDYGRIKDKLFNLCLSRQGRLRWQDKISSVDILLVILDKKKEEAADFIELYDNSYQEKEKLWKHFGLNGPTREKSDKEIVRAALKISLDAKAIFCINTIVDWLYLTDIFKGDAYQYRINTPGTISNKNWSFTIPTFLEELLRHKINKEIRRLVVASGRLSF